MHGEARERLEIFSRGYARISIRGLRFDTGRAADEKAIERLVEIFRSSQGCLNDDPKHAIQVISEGDATLTLPDTISDAPILDSSGEHSFVCLHGKQRVLAARKALPTREKWWLAQVFDRKLPPRLRKDVQQLNPETHTFADGEILKHILHAEKAGDHARVKQWKVLMGKWPREQFVHMTTYDDGRLKQCFEELLPFHFLLRAFRFGRMAPILGMRCHEETYAYLQIIHQRWTYILGSEVSPAAVDDRTAQVLELLAPKYSTHDYTTVCDLIDDGQIFSSVVDEISRAAIKTRLKECDRIVTIRSFFDDMIYARACFDALRTLLPAPSKHAPSTCLRDDLRRVYVRSPASFLDSYIDIWLFPMRNLAALLAGKNGTIRVCNSVRGRRILMASKQSQLAHLARYLGFQTDEIDEIIANGDPERVPETVADDRPELSCHRRNVCNHARSNRPCQATYQSIAESLYRMHIFGVEKEACKTFVTPYALIRDIVLCFWGDEYRKSKTGTAHLLLRSNGNDAAHLRAEPSSQTLSQDRGRSYRSDLVPERMSESGQLKDIRTRKDYSTRSESMSRSADHRRLPMMRSSRRSSHERPPSHSGRAIPSGASSSYSREPNDHKSMAALDNTSYSSASPCLSMLHDRRNLLGVRWDHDSERERLSFAAQNPERSNEPTEHRKSHSSPPHFILASTPTPRPADDYIAEDVLMIGSASTNETAAVQSDRDLNNQLMPAKDATQFFRSWDDSVDAIRSRERYSQDQANIMRGDGFRKSRGKRRADFAEGSPSPHRTRSDARLTQFPGQIGDATATEGPRRIHKQMWDTEQSIVESIFALDRKLSRSKVFVASSHDIAQPAHRHPIHDMLWAWAADEEKSFRLAFQRLSGEHTLKLVKQSSEHRSYTYEVADVRTCWKRLWQSHRPDTPAFGIYPFAILSNMQRSNKIMRADKRL